MSKRMQAFSSPKMDRSRVTEQLTEGVKSYFNDIGRPELLNRLGDDNIVVFQFINKRDAETICDYKLDKICRTIQEEKGIEILTDNVKAPTAPDRPRSLAVPVSG